MMGLTRSGARELSDEEEEEEEEEEEHDGEEEGEEEEEEEEEDDLASSLCAYLSKVALLPSKIVHGLSCFLSMK